MMVASAFGTAALATLQGSARVIDGDTLSVGGVVVRLHGIDAPERNQTCDGAGRIWHCGTWARTELVRLIGDGAVACSVLDTDRYGRAVGQCVIGTLDLGAALVESGAAVAYRRYSLAYVTEESVARSARRGIWRAGGDGLDMPSDWRALTRAAPVAAEVAPDGCAIKGNISRSGRIFHRPGQRDYARTRINPARGERWFCSDAEAESAGWRAARR